MTDAPLTGVGADAPTPYAFERLHRDSEGGEAGRLEAQNLLFERSRPLDQIPPLPEDAEILDAGSGTGFWALRLAALAPRGRITCLDRSPELLDLARRRLEPLGDRASYLLQDLRSLDLPKGAFHLVFTSLTLAHAPDLEAALGGLTAALRPGGWITCFEPVAQGRAFCAVHPPCPNLEMLGDLIVDMARERGSNLGAALAVVHHLDRLGLEEPALRAYGSALHGHEAAACVREVILPLARTYLRHRWDPEALERRVEAASREADQPHLWMHFNRAVALARKPLPGLGEQQPLGLPPGELG
ncbi:MAG TPA: class I SAM-dependent methyltransferase [Holophaga sp.]|nr:class I SAM-dependent methyltransferase [Holophaga sp.]